MVCRPPYPERHIVAHGGRQPRVNMAEGDVVGPGASVTEVRHLDAVVAVVHGAADANVVSEKPNPCCGAFESVVLVW